MKRVFLFLVTNILVIVTINIILYLLGIDYYLYQQGIDLKQLAAFCLVWGMTGSLISLAISKWMAKMSLGVQVVEKHSAQLGWLVSMVEQLSRKAGLPVAPEVGIWESPEVNAFATGPSKRNSLVAFSTGLLGTMSRDEIEGVAAHEIAHISNGDMVTMTLLQGVVNAFVMFFARIAAWAITSAMRQDNGERRETGSVMTQILITNLFEFVFGLLGMLVVAAFSRHREFRADAGGAEYAGREDMIAALERLAVAYRPYDKDAALATLKIAGGVGRLFASHPPLEKRIEALRARAY